MRKLFFDKYVLYLSLITAQTGTALHSKTLLSPTQNMTTVIMTFLSLPLPLPALAKVPESSLLPEVV